MDNEALIATEEGNLSDLKKRIDQDIDIDAQDSNGRTLLHHATSNGHHEVVKYLLKNGANVLLVTDKTNTALHIAMTKDDVSLARCILENVIRENLRKLLNFKTKANGTSALHVAAKRHCLDHVQLLLEYGANYEIVNNANEKPFDIACTKKIRGLFKLIDLCFAKATKGDKSFCNDDLENSKDDCYNAITNCRNNNGHTIIQVLLRQGHIELASEFLKYRVYNCLEDIALFENSNRQDEIDKLAERLREFRQYWIEQRKTIATMAASLRKGGGPREAKIITTHNEKLSCHAIGKAHEVLLAYRKFEGKQKSRTISAAMRSLGEILEVLGFDPENLYVVLDNDDGYYKKVPKQYKKDLNELVNLVNCIIDSTIAYLLKNIYDAQIFTAVIADDVAKVVDLMGRGAAIDKLERHHKTPLCYAVKKSSERMVKLLLLSGANPVEEPVKSLIHLAIKRGSAEIVKWLLKYVETEDLAEYVDRQQPLHAAAKAGRLDIIKILLRYGATYWIFDDFARTPLDLSSSQDVSDFLKLVDECFYDAKEANEELIEKVKAMSVDEFLAVTGTRNRQGQTLAIVAAKANLKNVAGMILRMIKEYKENEKPLECDDILPSTLCEL